MFLQWPDQTRQFCSRSFVARCFVALDFYFGQVIWAFHCLCHHFRQEMTCSTRQSNTGATPPVARHYIVAFWTDPNSGQSSLLFSALNSFIHCLFLLPGTIRLVWLGFAQKKHCLYIYHNIEIQISQSFQFCYTQIIASSTRNPSSNSQIFVKAAVIWFVVVYVTVELSSL